MEYHYYYHSYFVIIDHNNTASSEYTSCHVFFGVFLFVFCFGFFLPFKENQCRGTKRKMFEFPLESSSLLVHSIAPSLRVNMNITMFGDLYCLLIICLRNAYFFFLPKHLDFEAHIYPKYSFFLTSPKIGLPVPIIMHSKNPFNSLNDYCVSSISQGP